MDESLSINGLREAILEGVSSNLKTIEFSVPEFDKGVWIVLHEATGTIQKIIGASKIDEASEKEFCCLLMLTNCIVDLTAAHLNINSGFQRAGATVLRGIIENLSLCVAMHADQTDKIFEQYKADTYHIPKAVGPATKHFSEIGILYGQLTEVFAHEPFNGVGRAFLNSKGHTFFMLVPPVGRDHFVGHYTVSVFLAMIASLIGHVSEWCFVRLHEPKVYWHRFGNGELKSNESLTVLEIRKMKNTLEVALQSLK